MIFDASDSALDTADVLDSGMLICVGEGREEGSGCKFSFESCCSKRSKYSESDTCGSEKSSSVEPGTSVSSISSSLQETLSSASA